MYEFDQRSDSTWVLASKWSSTQKTVCACNAERALLRFVLSPILILFFRIKYVQTIMIEIFFTKITEVNLFAFAYRLFHEDFSPIYGANILNFLSSLYTLTLKVLNFWKFTSYCSLKPLWSGMGEVVPARTSPTLHPPCPPTVHQLSRLAL